MPERDPQLHTPQRVTSDSASRGSAADAGVDARIEQAVAEARSQQDFIDPDFSELTLSQVIARGLRAPRRTWRQFWQVLQSDSIPTAQTAFMGEHEASAQESAPARIVQADEAPVTPLQETQHEQDSTPEKPRHRLGRAGFVQLGLYLLAVLIAWWGVRSVHPAAGPVGNIDGGLGYFLLAIGVWVLAEAVGRWQALRAWWVRKDRRQRIQWALRLIPLGLFVVGSVLLIDTMDEPVDDLNRILGMVAPGIQLIILAGFVWGGLELILARWHGQLSNRVLASDSRIDRSDESAVNGAESRRRTWVDWLHPVRVFLVIFGLLLNVSVWLGTVGNQFDTLTFYMWLASIAVWALALAPMTWWRPLALLRRTWGALRAIRWQRALWVGLAIIGIVIVAAAFRLHDLNALPPEMTSDHVEKLLDAQKVIDGARVIFFANNGGRESLQMYVLAFFAELPGQGINFDSLKLLAVVEALITLPLLVWMSVAIMGPERRRLGLGVGLILALLVAVSYWHLAVTRLGLRIVLTPAVMALVMIFLARALRFNRRGDYILAGLTLGFGLYMYQAVRMIPLVIVVGVVIVIILRARTWRQFGVYVAHLAVLVAISFVVFLPMFHYSVENPEEFWRRTTGRLLGDGVVEVQNADGMVTQRNATLSDRIEAFNQNVPQLMRNMGNVLLMFHHRGDGGWINGYPGQPALDIWVGAWLIVGLGAWGALIVRTRDPVYVLVPLAALIMLLPSALSIAYPNENPSNTRTSGALPLIFLMAALPVGYVARSLMRAGPYTVGRGVAFGLVLVLAWGSYNANAEVYTTDFRRTYEESTFNYSEAGQILQGLALNEVGFGNAFMIASPHWWDHRAVGLEAGIEGVWPNGVYDNNPADSLTRSIDYLPHFMRDAAGLEPRFRFDPERDIAVFYAATDLETAAQLAEWFPDGFSTYYDNDSPRRRFYLFRTTALGVDGFRQFLENNIPPS